MKINKLIIGLVALISFTSCNDFLDVKDEAAINPSIWEEEASAELFINNIQGACMVPFGGEGLMASLANLSDETADMGSSLLLGTVGSGDVTKYSSVTYEPIRYVNIGLEAVRKTAKLTTVEKNRLLGQLYFFRAWQHWQLVNLYGGVPYMRNVVTFTSPDSITHAKRNTTSQCIQYLKADLDSAIAKLPAEWDKNEYSRITRAAAAAFKGRILLFYASPQFNPDNLAERWQEAYQANLAARDLCLADGYGLESIVTSVSKEYASGYNFNLIFSKKKSEGNKEVILVTPYAPEVKTHGFENSVCPSEFTTGAGSPSLTPIWDLVIAFPMKDGSLAFKYDPSSKNTRSFIGNAGDITKYYLNRDPRFYATIGFNGGYYQLESNADRKQWIYSCPKKTTTGTITYYAENVTSERTTQTGFMCKKMVNPNLLRDNMSKSSTDWIEMRYAEVLLNLAECAFQTQGDNSEVGYDCLKQIRKRAGITPGADDYYGLKSSSEISPIELVMNERRVEFAFEGKRFYDLRRRNMFTKDLGNYIYMLNGWKKSGSGYTFTLKNISDTAIFLYPEKRDTVKNENIYKYFKLTAKSTGPLVKSIKYLAITDPEELKVTTTGNYNFFGLPQDILTRSPNLTQNYGWQNGSFDPFK